MNDYTNLEKTIVEYFCDFKAYEIAAVCKKYGINCDESLNPMNSKRVFLKSGLSGKSFEELKCIAKQIIFEGCSASFVKNVEPYLNDDFYAFSMTTRRMLLELFCCQRDLEGNWDILRLISSVWNIESMYVTDIWGEQCPIKEYVMQHMIRNDDITYDELFEELLDFMYLSDDQLSKFLETIVSPAVRENGEQDYYVREINRIICVEGFQLIARKNIAGKPIYSLEKSVCGIEGVIQNVIFGAYDGKPDIVIDDSLVNTLKIVGNQEKCLFYTLPITTKGLTWRELVTWWNDGNDSYDINVEKALVERLKKSLDSEPEVLFIRTYYNFIHKSNNHELPALIPQVYCHYDPRSARMRNGQVYVHQRMDFLMLLPNGVRVVIEIDGKQHYSEGDTASPKKYAAMVEDDRALKLYGYDVYRFGGYEFLESNAVLKIEHFIQKLFEKYGLL